MSVLEELELEEREGRLPIRGTSLWESGRWEGPVAGLREELPASPVGPGGLVCCEPHLGQWAVDPSWGRGLWDSCPQRLLGEGRPKPSPWLGPSPRPLLLPQPPGFGG